MNKQLISFILCFMLLFSIMTFAFASTDVSKIQPDSYYGSEIIIGDQLAYYDPNYYIVTYDLKTGTVTIYPKYIPEVKSEEKQTPVSETTTQKVEEEVKKEDTIPNNTPIDITIHNEEEFEFINEIYKLVNEERIKENLKELYYDFDLQEAADKRAQEAAEKFEHTRPDGTSCFTVIEMDYNIAGENLIKADAPIATPENLMKSWMESEGHRYNILLPDYTSVTIGLYEKDNVIYASQLFIG